MSRLFVLANDPLRKSMFSSEIPADMHICHSGVACVNQ